MLRLQLAAPILRRRGSGISSGFMPSASTQATVTRARAITSSSRRISWANTHRALPSDSSCTPTAIVSSRRAGFTKSIATAVTTSATRCVRASPWWSKPRWRSHSVRARSRNFRYSPWYTTPAASVFS